MADLELLLAFPAVKKVLDLLRYLFEGENRQWREAAIVAASWIVGTGLVALLAVSSYAVELGLAGATLPDLILMGISIGSAAGVVADIRNGVTVF